MTTPELANSYAALILADDGVEVTVRRPHLPDNIQKRVSHSDQT